MKYHSNIWKSEFNKNVLTLLTGTTIAQAIPIAISPILTRIYTPDDFGILILFTAISSIFASISNGRYELAIMLPKKEEEAINIFALGFIINSILSLSLLIIVIVFNTFFTKLLNNDSISIWLYLIPLSVFIIGLFNILVHFNNRLKSYKNMATASVIKSIVLAVIQISVGLFKGGVSGLISGQIISQAIENIQLFKDTLKNKKLLPHVNRLKIIALAKKYINFPKYSLWGILANSLSHHLTKILIPSLFSLATLGLYSLVQRVLGLPSALIGESIGKVYFQEASKEKQMTGKALKTFKSTFLKLLLIAIPSFGLIFFVSKDLFAFVFGEEWRIAGVYAQITTPFFFVKFISSSLSGTLTVFEKQKSELVINLLLISGSVGIIWMFKDFISFLQVFSIVLSIFYGIFIIYYYKLSKGKT